MTDVFGTPDGFIPDFGVDGTEIGEDDLQDKGGQVNKKGYYHLELTDRKLMQEEGKPNHVNCILKVLQGEHEDQIGKTVFHRVYLERYEYETDEKGNFIMEKAQRSNGEEYEMKKKTGKILPLDPKGYQVKGNARFFIGIGLLKESECVGQKFSLPFSKFNPGIQFIAVVGKDGQIEFNKTFCMEDDEVANIPKDEQSLANWLSGNAAGVDDSVIDSI